MKKIILLLMLLLAFIGCGKKDGKSKENNQSISSVEKNEQVKSDITEGYIGSFNTLRLGKNKNKDFKKMAKIVSQFDIVGLVEVMTPEGLQQLVDELNKLGKGKWEYTISPKAVGTEDYKEYYGYVYRKDRVKLVKQIGFFPEKKNEFIREPYGAEFKIGNFDFTFVLMHSIYGKKASQRQAEAAQFDRVYDYFQGSDSKENDIIIAGDFNLPANDSSFKKLLSHKDNIIYTIDPTTKTTIGTKGLASCYDNMFLSKKYTTEFKGKSGAIDITKGNFAEVRKVVSDHLPIFIKVDSRRDDD